MGSSEIGRFRIIGVLGSGAEGVVALAHDHEDASSEPIVLKVLRGRTTDSAPVARLREEARILAWLCHPNIVKVHRLLEKDGLPIVVMEHVEGTSAMEQIRARGPLPTAVALEIARRAALALEAAYETRGPSGHPMRIVHRDIKPANLLLSLSGEVKVVDFGIATGASEDGGPASDLELMGTPGYIAPERRSGGPDTPAVDVYALGATLYVLLTGKVLVQPVSVARHDPSLERALTHLAPSDVEEPVARSLQSLLFDMSRFDPDLRPSPSGLVQRLEAMTTRLGPPDLKVWAEEEVAPVVRARPPIRTEAHPELALLEGGGIRDLGVSTPGPARGLALRPAQAPTEIEPMLATLAPGPWWRFWQVSRDPTRLVAALVALRGTRDPRAVSRAYELTRHRDPQVAEAAWELLAAAC